MVNNTSRRDIVDLSSFLQRELVKVILGFIVGGIIGLERQFLMVKEEVGELRPGVRSLGLISLMGTISIIISRMFSIFVFFFSILGVLFITSIWTVMRAYYFQELGITTSIALLISFLVGVTVGMGEIVLGITLSVFVTFILSVKSRVKEIINALEYKEIISALRIGILSLLLFPIIPDIRDPLFNTIHLRTLFFFLVLVLSISFFSYVILKRLGSHQELYSFAVLGAIVNSEAVTTNLVELFTHETEEIDKSIVNSILLINLIMIVRTFFLATVLGWNQPSLLTLFGSILGGMLLFGTILFFIRGVRRKGKEVKRIELKSPLVYETALRFIATFIGVSFLLIVIQRVFREGFVIAGLLGGIISNMAVLFVAISLLQLSALSIHQCVGMITLGTATALLNKLIFAKLGGATKEILSRLTIDILLLEIVGLLIANYLFPFLPIPFF